MRLYLTSPPSSGGGGGGEANTASNLGAGEGVYASKSGVNLRFKSLKAGSNVSLSSSSTEVEISATGGTASYTEVATYNDLPIAIGSPAVGTLYVVQEASGYWFINRKEAGIYRRATNLGALSDWVRLGEWVALAKDSSAIFVDDEDTTKAFRFEVEGVTAGQTRILYVPDASGVVALTSDARFTDARTPTAHTHVKSEVTDFPSLGNSSSLDVGSSAGTVCAGDDARLSNARTPTAHTHTKSEVTDFPALGNSSSLDVGTSSGTVCAGDDSRLSDARTPTAHNHTKAEITDFPSLGNSSSLDVGSSAGTVCAGDDSRLSNARTPTAHNHTKSEITDFPALGNASGLDVGSSAGTVCAGDDARLSNSRTPTSHASSHQSGGGDAIKLDSLATPDDNTNLNATTERHGLLPKLGGGSTNFLRADGTWAAPAGGGGGEANTASNLGAGTGLFASKSGVDLRFKSLVQGSNVTITNDGDTVTIASSGGGGGGSPSTVLQVNASSARASVTDGADFGAVQTSSGNPDLITMDFDAGTEEFIQFSVPYNTGWSGSVKVKFFWSHPSTTTNFGVVWKAQAVAVGDDDSLSVAFSGGVTVTDTGGTTDDLYVSSYTAGLAIAGSPAEGDLIFFRVSRDAADGADTLAVDARLHYVEIDAA